MQWFIRQLDGTLVLQELTRMFLGLLANVRVYDRTSSASRNRRNLAGLTLQSSFVPSIDTGLVFVSIGLLALLMSLRVGLKVLDDLARVFLGLLGDVRVLHRSLQQ